MTLAQTIAAVPMLTVAERLQLADAIWDSLDDSDVPPLTSAQQLEISRRLAAHDADPSTALTKEQVESQLSKLRRQ